MVASAAPSDAAQEVQTPLEEAETPEAKVQAASGEAEAPEAAESKPATVETTTGAENRWNITLTQEEIDLLAKIVWLESQGEPTEGQEAVVEVVFNRMASEKYPDTLYDVLSQGNPTQFCSDVYKRQIMPLMTWATHVLQWRKQREAIPRGGANLKNNVSVRTVVCNSTTRSWNR